MVFVCVLNNRAGAVDWLLIVNIFAIIFTNIQNNANRFNLSDVHRDLITSSSKACKFREISASFFSALTKQKQPAENWRWISYEKVY